MTNLDPTGQLEEIVEGLKHWLLVPLNPDKADLNKLMTPGEAREKLNQVIQAEVIRAKLEEVKTFDELQYRHMWQPYQKRRIKELEAELAELEGKHD